MNVSCDSKGLSTWNIKVFERQRTGLFKLHEEDICEQAFSYIKIKDALSKKFSKVHILDLSSGKVSAKSRNLHFVCEK